MCLAVFYNAQPRVPIYHDFLYYFGSLRIYIVSRSPIKSGSTISSYETGRNQPSFDMLIQYADYFNVTTDYLLGRVPFDMSPSVFTDSFIDNVTIQDVISILQKLPDNRRRALLVLLGDIQLSSTIQEQAKKASKGG